jgi:hypothetical protein
MTRTVEKSIELCKQKSEEDLAESNRRIEKLIDVLGQEDSGEEVDWDNLFADTTEIDNRVNRRLFKS